jgi:hypothetical protein
MDFNELGVLLKDHQTGMSDFQDDYLVTAKAGGTVYGQYKQALRETYRRFRGLRELIYGDRGRKMLDIEIEELQEKYDNMEEGRDRDRLEVKLKHRIMIREESDRAIKDTYREFIRFYQQSCALKEKVGELTPQRRRELEIDMWRHKAKGMICSDLSHSKFLSPKTLEFVTVMPKVVKQELFEILQDKEKLNRVKDEFLYKEEVYTLDFESMELPKLEDINNLDNLIEEHSRTGD